jgi:hypothetical protein
MGFWLLGISVPPNINSKAPRPVHSVPRGHPHPLGTPLPSEGYRAAGVGRLQQGKSFDERPVQGSPR